MKTDMTAIEKLAVFIREHGAIPAVRVSSAQARGAAKNYAYWGTVRYTVTLRKDGAPMLQACERAASERRSERLAYADADALATAEGRIRVYGIPPGSLIERDAARIIDQIRA